MHSSVSALPEPWSIMQAAMSFDARIAYRGDVVVCSYNNTTTP